MHRWTMASHCLFVCWHRVFSFGSGTREWTVAGCLVVGSMLWQLSEVGGMSTYGVVDGRDDGWVDGWMNRSMDRRNRASLTKYVHWMGRLSKQASK